MYSTENNKWFTLIEVLMAVLIFSFMAVSAFSVFVDTIHSKIYISDKINLEKNAFISSEKLISLIKNWGTIDYEEYFNRKALWETLDTDESYILDSDYWNSKVWNTSFYYCRSTNTKKLSNWCYDDLDLISDKSWISPATNKIWENQLFGQYSFQFIDFNENWITETINDNWDENADWSIIWDDDDEDLGTWPIAFSQWKIFNVLYLINKTNYERTFLEYNITQDPNTRPWEVCNPSTADRQYCIWKIMIKRMKGYDWWQEVTKKQASDKTYWDWIIDTWVMHSDVTWFDDNTVDENEIITNRDWNSNTINNDEEYAYSLFPDTISVKDVKYVIYPNTSSEYAWKSDSNSTENISPYVKLQLTLTMSAKWRDESAINPPEMTISTTINLTDYK